MLCVWCLALPSGTSPSEVANQAKQTEVSAQRENHCPKTVAGPRILQTDPLPMESESITGIDKQMEN